MRRLLLLPLLLLLLPASALASPAGQVRLAVKKYELAWSSGSGQAVCALLPLSEQKAISLIWADAIQQAEVDCPTAVMQQMRILPHLRQDSDPALVAKLRKLRLASIQKGKITIARRQAALTVKYRAPGCRTVDTWKLQRFGRRWTVTGMAQGGDIHCYAQPANVEQTAALRALASQQVAAAFAGDAATYCNLTEPWSWRQFGIILRTSGLEYTTDCLTDLPKIWSMEGMTPPPAEELARQQDMMAQTTWQVRGDHAWSSVATHQLFTSCWSKEPYEAWRVGDQWLLSAPSPGPTTCV